MTITQIIKQLDNGYHLEPKEVAEGIKRFRWYQIELEKRHTEPKVYTSGILLEALTSGVTMDQLNEIVYGSDNYKTIAMQLFIDSRMEYCKQDIINQIIQKTQKNRAASDHLSGNYGEQTL